MREQCVPGSLSSSPAQEPGNEASKEGVYVHKCVCVCVCVCWMLLSNQIFEVGLHEVEWAEVIMVVAVSC